MNVNPARTIHKEPKSLTTLIHNPKSII